MPLRINEALSEIEKNKSGANINQGLILERDSNRRLTQFGFEETNRTEQQKANIIQNLGNLISQRIAIKNLHLNKTEYKKYVKKRVKCGALNFKWVTFRNSKLKANSMIFVQLNRFEMIFFRFLLISMFFVSWVLGIATFTVAIFH